MSTLSTSAAESATPRTTAAPTLLRIRNVAKRFGTTDVLRDISLDIALGEFLTILGESGSGKTTLLRIIAGFEQATSGEVWMENERLDQLPPYRRRVNTVFQQYALFPHLTVFENVAYGLRIQQSGKADIASRVEQALAMVKMTTFAQSKPAKISGGQQQRVALARALVKRPRMLLLDEPLSALDANLRRQMQLELKSLQREIGIAFVFVTHDQEEAMVMSDRIALLRSGDLEQVATPREIYNRPATAYAAQFIGQTNLLRADVVRGIAHYGQLSWPTNAPDGPATFSLRPECIGICTDLRNSSPSNNVCHSEERSDEQPLRHVEPLRPTDTVRFRARVITHAFHGATDLLHVDAGVDSPLIVRTTAHATAPAARPDAGEERDFEFSPSGAIIVSDPERAAAPRPAEAA